MSDAQASGVVGGTNAGDAGDDDAAVAAEWDRIEQERLAEERAEARADVDPRAERRRPRALWRPLFAALMAGVVAAVLANVLLGPRDLEPPAQDSVASKPLGLLALPDPPPPGVGAVPSDDASGLNADSAAELVPADGSAPDFAPVPGPKAASGPEADPVPEASPDPEVFVPVPTGAIGPPEPPADGSPSQ